MNGGNPTIDQLVRKKENVIQFSSQPWLQWRTATEKTLEFLCTPASDTRISPRARCENYDSMLRYPRGVICERLCNRAKTRTRRSAGSIYPAIGRAVTTFNEVQTFSSLGEGVAKLASTVWFTVHAVRTAESTTRYLLCLHKSLSPCLLTVLSSL
jgi:hypothetical protein